MLQCSCLYNLQLPSTAPSKGMGGEGGEEERGNHMEKQLGEEFNIMITQEGEGVGEKGFSCLFTYNQLLFTFLLPCDRVEVGEVSSGK